jgi:hypothetical protein
MRLIDADELRKCAIPCEIHNGALTDMCVPLYQIDNAPTVEEIEKPFITECRNASIEENLPLYFVYYEETGVVEIYITETKELFEKRHCPKHLPNYKFKEVAINYLDWYFDWKGSADIER